MTIESRPYALVSVGELLADLVGHHVARNLMDTQDFRRYQGGSPANMAGNMARLGGNVALVASVGDDNIGKFLVRQVADTGVDTQFITQHPSEPTTIVLVSRTAGTPDFVVYRHADCQLSDEQLTDELLGKAQVFHTTCFALSKQPAQRILVSAAKRAKQQGCTVSIDTNYAPSVWPDREEAWRVLHDYFSTGPLVKISEDDAERLYGERQTSEKIIQDFHRMGASVICLTLGSEGSLVSYEGGAKQARLPGRKIDVVDVTGAGDAYWAGFLTAYLDGYAPGNCAHAGAALAKMKLTRLGPLPDKIDKQLLYEQFL